MRTRLPPIAVACLLAVLLVAADWPQFRGPNRDDVSMETGLLKTWPPQGPPLLWTCTETGLGYSGPAIVGNRLYTMGARGPMEYAIVLDTATGKQVWATEVGPIFDFKGNIWGPGPRSTPTVDGDRVYALGGFGELVCLETATGKTLWHHNLFKEFNGLVMHTNGPAPIGWGYAEGPLVDGERVVVTPGGEDGTLLAFNKRTGAVLWRSKEVKDEAPYSSIIIGEVGGIRHYIQMTGKGVVGVAPEDGRLLWRFEEDHDDLVIRTPIFHDGDVFTTVGMARGSVMVHLTAEGKNLQASKLYANKNMKNELGGVVLVGANLYGYSEGKGWICQQFKKPGDIRWSEKRKLGKGSVTCADGQLYCYGDEDGTVVLAEANASKWKENGRFKIPARPRTGRRRGRSGRTRSSPTATCTCATRICCSVTMSISRGQGSGSGVRGQKDAGLVHA